MSRSKWWQSRVLWSQMQVGEGGLRTKTQTRAQGFGLGCISTTSAERGCCIDTIPSGVN